MIVKHTMFGKTRLVAAQVCVNGRPVDDTAWRWDRVVWIEREEDGYGMIGRDRVLVVRREDWLEAPEVGSPEAREEIYDPYEIARIERLSQSRINKVIASHARQAADHWDGQELGELLGSLSHELGVPLSKIALEALKMAERKDFKNHT